MADFKIRNLSLRIEDQPLPAGTIIGQGKFIGDTNLLAGGDGGDGGGGGADGGCGCSCTCSCTCTCTSTGSAAAVLPAFEEGELETLRESLRGALTELERIQQQRREQAAGEGPDVG